MSMVDRKCPRCGMRLAPYESFCSNCGHHYEDQLMGGQTLPSVSLSPSGPGVPPQEAREVAAPYGSIPPPPTAYGPQSYGTYPPPSYNVPPPPPPLPPARPQGPRIGLIVGIGLLLLVLVGGGVFALTRLQSPASPTPVVGPTARPTVNTAATATSAANQNPYTHSAGTLVLNDPMSDNSRGYKWDEGTMNGGTCRFVNGSYHIQAPQNGFVCVPEAAGLNFSNLAFEAKLTLIQGNQEALAFRLDQNQITFYGFYIYANGTYVLDSFAHDKFVKALASGSSPAINKGQGQTNLLAIVAQGPAISIYVNGQLLKQVSDNAIAHGQIGVEAFSDNGAAEVSVGNVRVWKL